MLRVAQECKALLTWDAISHFTHRCPFPCYHTYITLPPCPLNPSAVLSDFETTDRVFRLKPGNWVMPQTPLAACACAQDVLVYFCLRRRTETQLYDFFCGSGRAFTCRWSGIRCSNFQRRILLPAVISLMHLRKLVASQIGRASCRERV